MKTGLIFAGQGAQYPGMGKSLYDNSAAAREVFHTAGQQVMSWCFEGTKEQLMQTDVTQPAVYTVSMAAYEAFCESVSRLDKTTGRTVEISGAAGFSLGEYSALTAAGSIGSIKKGIEIVRARGMMMNEAGADDHGTPRGGMMVAMAERAAVLECVEEARGDGILCGVNFNGPKQTVVAGDFEALERFKNAAADRKIRAMTISVGAAFHSPMMEPAAQRLWQLLLDEQLKSPKLKLYSNVTAQDMMAGKPANRTAEEFIAELMAKQAMSPVYWQEIIEHMIADGIQCFVELGPGKALSGMVRKINPDVGICNVEDAESLAAAMEKLNEMQNQMQSEI